MPRVNLLPWRDTKRAELQRDFMVSLIVSLVMAAGVIGCVDYYIEGWISFQNTRNSRLDQEITTYKTKIVEVENLKKELANLHERMDIVQRLQGSRPEIVHLFDEIPKLLPEGIYLTNLTQRSNIITIEGGAQSNARVSTLMRNIATSKWLSDPVLGVIQTSQQGDDRINKFNLQTKQFDPNENKEEKKNEKENGKENKKNKKTSKKTQKKPTDKRGSK